MLPSMPRPKHLKPRSFSSSLLRKGRHVLSASHFYEWKRLDETGKKRQPYLIGMKDEPFVAFAGLWERNEVLGITSCTMISTVPNEFMKPLHRRMPVFLPRDRWNDWLTKADQRVLVPCDAAKMYGYEIGPAVGNVRNKGPEIMEPLTSKAEKAPKPKPKAKKSKKPAEHERGNLF